MLRHHILVIGDCQVGKSSFCIQLAENNFTDAYMSTLFTEQYNVRVKDHLLIFYDTPGNERFHIGLEPKYAQCDIALLFVNETSKVEEWFQRVRRWNPLMSWLVIANTSSKKAKQWADKHNKIFYEINIKTRQGFKDVIQQILQLTHLYASRPFGLNLQTSDEEYLHYCS